MQGAADKLAAYEGILRDAALADAQVGYMGDDLQDLAVLRRVGFSAAPADAPQEIRRHVDWVSEREGGRGAVRELIEHILQAQGTWPAAVGDYLAEREPR